jgi:hypothetical protein
MTELEIAFFSPSSTEACNIKQWLQATGTQTLKMSIPEQETAGIAQSV